MFQNCLINKVAAHGLINLLCTVTHDYMAHEHSWADWPMTLAYSRTWVSVKVGIAALVFRWLKLCYAIACPQFIHHSRNILVQSHQVGTAYHMLDYQTEPFASHSPFHQDCYGGVLHPRMEYSTQEASGRATKLAVFFKWQRSSRSASHNESLQRLRVWDLFGM